MFTFWLNGTVLKYKKIVFHFNKSITLSKFMKIFYFLQNKLFHFYSFILS